MNIGKAVAIFKQIESDKYRDSEKLEAIKMVLNAETYNSIRKDTIIKAFRWLFEYGYEEVQK